MCFDEWEGRGIEGTTHNPPPPFLLLSPFIPPLPLYIYINLTLKNDSSLLDRPVRERFNVEMVALCVSFVKVTVLKLTITTYCKRRGNVSCFLCVLELASGKAYKT